MGALALQVRVKRVGQAERAFLCPTLWLSKWDPGVGMGKGPGEQKVTILALANSDFLKSPLAKGNKRICPRSFGQRHH